LTDQIVSFKYQFTSFRSSDKPQNVPDAVTTRTSGDAKGLEAISHPSYKPSVVGAQLFSDQNLRFPALFARIHQLQQGSILYEKIRHPGWFNIVVIAEE